MPIFGLNQDYTPSTQGPTPRGLPVEQVRGMRAQGMDNNQIIQSLQRDGYSSSDIFDSMNQADMMENSPAGTPHRQNSGFDEDIPPPPSDEYQNPIGGGSDFMTSHQLPGKQSDFSAGNSSTEELIEAIIDEKWNELVKDLGKVVEWKNSTNSKIIQLDQKFSDLKQEFDKLHSAIISKIDDYDKNITNVGAEVKAMEKVFSKVLPVFTENVSELSKITKNVKRSASKK